VGLIAYLSLTPLQVRTPAPAGVEHAVAYAGTAGLMVLAYTSRPVWLIVGLLAFYSVLMELLQNFSPGRHPGLDGVLWSSAGAIAGGWGSEIVSAILRRARPRVDRTPRSSRDA
jgi:VanZ family protein